MASALLFLSSVMIGCQSDPPGEEIPRYSGLTDQQILDRLSDRADAIESISASGLLRIEKEDGQTITVDAVLLAQGDDRIRLRAWKLGRAVFDLTRDGEGLWLWVRGKTSDEADTVSNGLTAEQVGIGWSLMSGRILSQSPDMLQTGDPLVLLYHIDRQNKTVARLEVDRQTVTVQRCDLLAAQGAVLQSVIPEQYRLIDGIPLATRIISTSPRADSERFTLEINEVEINTELPGNAFTPPSKATRSP